MCQLKANSYSTVKGKPQAKSSAKKPSQEFDIFTPDPHPDSFHSEKKSVGEVFSLAGAR